MENFRDKVLLEQAKKWFKSMSLEEQFYKTINANHLLEGDTVDNHPDKLSDSDILIVYKNNFNLSYV